MNEEINRCGDCGVIVPNGYLRCSYCQNHLIAPERICACSKVIRNQTYERWKQSGNFCDECMRKVNSTLLRKGVISKRTYNAAR